MDKETEARGLRYVFKGFELNLIEQISRNLEKTFLVKIPVVSLNEKYDQAIKSRANDEPIFIWITGRTVSEYSSLSSTYKCLMNVFHPFQKRWERVEGIYDLHDVTEWLFRQDKLETVSSAFLAKEEYSTKKRILEESYIWLKILWDLSLTNPSLRNRLEPGSIARILASISSSREFDFNDLVKAIGFAPCIAIPQDRRSITTFFDDSKKLILLLKGSDPDKKSKFAKLCENSIAGLVLFYHKKQNNSRIKPPGDFDLILRRCREKDEKGRRSWVVPSSDVEIREYSLSSGLVSKVVFRLRHRKTKETCSFNNAWNFSGSDEKLDIFLKYLNDENIIGPKYANKTPFVFTVREDEVELTFNFMEAYLFGRKNFRKELDEIQI
jgi:hypothetical protein